QPGGEPPELDADLRDRGQVGDRDARDEGHPVRDHGHQVLLRQAPQGFADRGSAEAELLAEPSLLDHRAGRQAERDDLVSNLQVRLLTQRQRPVGLSHPIYAGSYGERTSSGSSYQRTPSPKRARSRQRPDFGSAS